MRAIRAFKDIFLAGNTQRIWLILGKSPLIHVMAWVHGLKNTRVKKERAALAQKIKLNPDQTRILEQLREKGYARVDELLSVEDLQSLEKYLNEKMRELADAKTQPGQAKDFWLRLSDNDVAKGMSTNHPLVAVSLKKDLLEIVTAYLKSAPFFDYTLLTYSIPSKGPLKISQLWHRDYDNDNMVKLFIYLSDVKHIADGPFTLLPQEATKKIKNSFISRHLTDDTVNRYYPLDQKVEIMGPKFTAFLVNTNKCYHMGSRVLEGHSRLMSTSLFLTLPKAYWNPLKSFVRPERELSELEKRQFSLE